jgi:2-(1,2-epoxy-1,2-dihydrophenyl)acetyl-CoA isomerase
VADEADEIVVEMRGDVAVVRLNRPSRGNSVTPAVVQALGRTAEDLSGDARALVLTGTGRVFCAGADATEMHEVFLTSGMDGLCDYLSDVWMPAVQATVRALWALPVPVVAAINGAATAGGLDFALTCDARLAAPSARFAESYVNLGMVPVAGGAFLLPWLVGPAAAMEILATGRLIDAVRAHELSVVSAIHEPDALVPAAVDLAGRLASGPASTFAHTKRIMRQRWTKGLDVALDESLAANIQLLRTDDVRRALQGVLEKFSA